MSDSGEQPFAPIAGVIGSPIIHSRSPAIFTAAFEAADIDWGYFPFEVNAGGAEAAIESMKVLGLRGLSVTMPLKAEALAAVDRPTPAALTLGAVNCIGWDRNELVGHNTDGDGFVASLLADDVKVSGSSVAIIGAGGAARSIVDAMARHGCSDIVVINRSTDRAEAAARLASAVGRVGTHRDLSDVDTVINATPIGMNETEWEGQLPCAASALGAHQTVVDIVYNPLETPLLAAARATGAKTIDGLSMLVHQAARQFQLWTGTTAPITAMDTAARQTGRDVRA